MSNIYFPICAFVISTLICLIYYAKKRLNTIETKVYGYLLVCNVFEALSACIILAIALRYGKPDIIKWLNRIDFTFILLWVSLLFKYIHYVTFEKDYKKVNKFIIGFDIIAVIAMFIADMELINENGVMDSVGLSPTLLYLFAGIYIALTFVTLVVGSLKDRKKLTNKKYIPLYSLIFLAIVMMIVRQIKPELTLLSFIIMYVDLIMYFTIENPDVRMIKELNIARDQAEKANAAKTDFLSNMSHEIRTPLNAIVGFSNLLLENEKIPEDAKEEIHDIIMASDNLLEIVNGILDISKIEANKLEIVNNEYCFAKLTNELIALTKGRLGDKPIEFKTKIDASIPEVLYGDSQRLKQICVNILTNAVKYTKEGWIELNISSVIKDDVCRLIIAVEDTGIGIKTENINKLFNRFERLDLKENITIEGTGLGLAITKKLVDLMQGKIVVQSVFGKGSKFTVSIDQRIVKNPTIKLEETKPTESVIVNNKKVLLVDDNKINLKVAERLLDAYGLEVEAVESGFACLEKIKSGCIYDLILLDDMMPKMSGVETLKKLKEIDGFNIKTVALTANALTGMREKYLADGFDDYLAKPINKDELNKIINKYLNDN